MKAIMLKWTLPSAPGWARVALIWLTISSAGHFLSPVPTELT